MSYAIHPSAGQPVSISDGANLDAFSRLRVSEPVGVFDSTFQYDLQPVLFYQTVANGGAVAHSAANASAVLSLAGTAGGSAILQSKAYHRYIPAKSQLVAITGTFGAAVPGVVRRVGYFDASDGVFFEQTAAGAHRLVRRTSTSGSPVDNGVEQASWNLDKLDGKGPSRHTFDPTKNYILVIDLQWLGMGRVRVGFDIGGQIVYCHEFLNAQVLTTVYMRTANLPVRWETSGDAAASMLATCSAVISEGGREQDRGFPFSSSNTTAITAASGARTALMCLRPAATFNSIVNRIQIALDEFAALVTGNNPVKLELLYGATVSGGSWAVTDASSAAEINLGATYGSGGTVIGSLYVPATAANKFAQQQALPAARLPITLDPAGANPRVVALVATGLGGTSATWGRLSWRELR